MLDSGGGDGPVCWIAGGGGGPVCWIAGGGGGPVLSWVSVRGFHGRRWWLRLFLAFHPAGIEPLPAPLQAGPALHELQRARGDLSIVPFHLPFLEGLDRYDREEFEYLLASPLLSNMPRYPPMARRRICLDPPDLVERFWFRDLPS